MSEEHASKISRRQFNTAMVSASAMALAGSVNVRGAETLKAAWIGCGGRGTRDVQAFLGGCDGVEMVALADTFQDKIDHGRNVIKKFPKKDKVTDDDCYVGLDAYKKVMARDDVDIVIHTTPPGFRPRHVEAAIDAGKHVFAEKPGGTDPVGLRQLIRANEKAKEKGLSIVVGTQQRRMAHYKELMRRVLEDGAIGEIVGADIAWHCAMKDWHFQERKPEWSDMEWQIRCWPFFTWLSGDHVVEQHLHNCDVLNWALGTPNSCLARGGRQVRTGEEYGNIYDHFSGVFYYDDHVRAYSGASQMLETTRAVYERLIGTKGTLWVDRGGGYITGENAYEYDGPHVGGTTKQFQDLVASIRNDEPIQEAQRLAESTGIAMTERMCAYTGLKLKYDWVMNSSKEELVWPEEKMRMGPLPVRDVRMPGKAELV